MKATDAHMQRCQGCSGSFPSDTSASSGSVGSLGSSGSVGSLGSIGSSGSLGSSGSVGSTGSVEPGDGTSVASLHFQRSHGHSDLDRSLGTAQWLGPWNQQLDLAGRNGRKPAISSTEVLRISC